MDERYIGLILALVAALLTGASFIITKKGLMTSKGHGTAEGFEYLVNSLWWVGMGIMVMGELANFAAYSFAPAILVTPLGALSVLVSAVLASVFLGDHLGKDGMIGCALCLLGSLVIIIHAPEERQVDSVQQLLTQYVLQPGFMIYCILVVGGCLLLIYKLAPLYGKQSPLIYISICSLTGSLTVIACKAFGIALKLTFAGNNQFTDLSTYIFIILVIVTIMTQMNYFNKALDVFSTSLVTPVYYVFFTTATIVANVILFQGIYMTSGVDLISILVGFITIFIGVFLLNSPKPSSSHQASRYEHDNLGPARKNHLHHPSRSKNSGYQQLDDDYDLFRRPSASLPVLDSAAAATSSSGDAAHSKTGSRGGEWAGFLIEDEDASNYGYTSSKHKRNHGIASPPPTLRNTNNHKPYRQHQRNSSQQDDPANSVHARLLYSTTPTTPTSVQIGQGFGNVGDSGGELSLSLDYDDDDDDDDDDNGGDYHRAAEDRHEGAMGASIRKKNKRISTSTSSSVDSKLPVL